MPVPNPTHRSSALPRPPRRFIDSEMVGGFFDRPTHLAPLRAHALAEGLWLREGIVPKEGEDVGHRADRWRGPILLPVDEGLDGDIAKELARLLLGELERNATQLDMLTERLGI